MALLQIGMPRALSRLPNTAFVCRQCLRQQPHQKLLPTTSTRPLSSRIAQVLARHRGAADATPRRYASSGTSSSGGDKKSLAGFFNSGGLKYFSSKAPSLSATAEAASEGANGSFSRSSSFPETNSRSVGYWLLGSAASVFGIVVFGGLTRLTESGLSITEWRPVTGSVPPRNAEDWESEFAKYRASPEYALINPNMDLDEFKKIYFMEWTHRLWGRLIGLSFVAPALYFVARRRVTRRMAMNIAGISALIGFQGFIGWWMVSSGLKDDLFAPGSHPRVSQYRLTAHLGTAFVCYGWMLLSGLSVLRTRRMLLDPAAAASLIEKLRSPALRNFRRLAYALGALAFTTAMSGALVAGLDAGLIYNEFPKMGKGYAPPMSELFDKFYSRKEDGSDLWWRNALENPSLVQLDHRVLAVTTVCAVLALFAYSRTGRVAAAMPPSARKGMMGVVHLALAQVTLGYFTLVYMVPTHLAATHQAGALALLTGVLVLLHRLRVPPKTIALVQRKLLKGAATTGSAHGGTRAASSLPLKQL